MEFPRNLRWIGPLFLILFLILWIRRGFLPFLYIILYSFIIPPFIPITILILIAIVTIFRYPRHRFSGLVAYLTFFSSGILVEPIPMPYFGPYPPPPVLIAVPTLLFTPLFAILYLVVSGRYMDLPMMIGFLLLILLSILTYIVSKKSTESKIDSLRAMVLLVLILLGWTFSFIPFYLTIIYGRIFTPIPLGPLVVLNYLPLIRNNREETTNQ